ncbi:MAG: hypothetical protein OMM_10318, partial [Candidatus Magnetoglobus multicellularis str. Araruama]
SDEYSFTVDLTSPVPGNNGNLTPVISDTSSITITWALASDTIENQNNLQYNVYVYAGNWGSSVENWENNATFITTTTNNVSQARISGLNYGQQYYATVIVSDTAGNKSIYARQQINTVFFVDDTSSNFAGVYEPSVAFGDYDADGDLDIIISGSTNSGSSIKIYKNTNGLFEDTGIVLTPVSQGKVAWGDYDNDNDLDLVITGSDVTKIYQNNLGSFDDINASIPGLSQSDAVWGDLDNDGDLDLLISGTRTSDRENFLYLNNNGIFQVLDEQLTDSYGNGFVSLADYDNDMDLDLILSGYNQYHEASIQIYQNQFTHLTVMNFIDYYSVPSISGSWGDYDNDSDLDLVVLINGIEFYAQIFQNNNGIFNPIMQMEMRGGENGSAAWGDYDNDGDLDVIIAGNAMGTVKTTLYQNTNGVFTDPGTEEFAPFMNCDMTWGDVDNDNDLDLLISGYQSGVPTTKLYRNLSAEKNTIPAAPDNLTSAVSGSYVTLSWTSGTDSETPGSGLNYNLRIGTTPDGMDILSPMAIPISNGFRMIPSRGPIQCLTATVHLPYTGTFYWSVQSIDTAFAGSAFAAEQTFTITNSSPVLADTTLSIETLTSESITLTWTSATDTETLSENITYIVYSATNDLGLDISNWERNASPVISWTNHLTRITISPLTKEEMYYFTVIAKDQSDNKMMYDRINITMPIFIERTDISFPQVTKGDCAWGDYDQDGDLDLFLCGSTGSSNIARIYRNDQGNFTDIGASLTGLTPGKASWGDYDNDGDLDLIVTGKDINDQLQTILYQNTNGNFVDSGMTFSNLEYSSAIWGDCDHDGDLDLMISGWETQVNQSVILFYKNNGTTFSGPQELTDLFHGTLVLSDFNHDRYLDILTTGNNEPQVFVNNGAGQYTSCAISFNADSGGTGLWGDYDMDGDLDIFVAKDFVDEGKIFENRNNTFVDIHANVVSLNIFESQWLDYDNDGDLDLFVTGVESYYNTTQARAYLYRNDLGVFKCLDYSKIYGVYHARIAPGDYDNDGDLDLMIIGTNNNAPVAKLLENTMTKSNTAPSAPTFTQAIPSGNLSIELNWTEASDNETPSPGLTYQLMIGTSPDAIDIKAPMALPLSSGYRQVPESTVVNTTGYILHDLQDGTYYCRVQAIDSVYAGSSFSNAYSFTVDLTPPAPGNNGTISTSLSTAKSVTISWQPASDTNDMDANIQYQVYYSTSNFGSDLDLWDYNATVVQSWTPYLTQTGIDNLVYGSTYYVNIAVRDSSGNKTMYTPAL